MVTINSEFSLLGLMNVVQFMKFILVKMLMEIEPFMKILALENFSLYSILSIQCTVANFVK